MKFYDANTDGIKGTGEPTISGWRVGIDVNGDNTPDYFTLTDATGSYSFGDLDNADKDNNPLTGSDLGPGTYKVIEGTQANWVATTPISVSVIAGGTGVQSGGSATADFGNVKLGQTGGKTKGFWGNKNGLALIRGADIAGLNALNLRKADGSNFSMTQKVGASTVEITAANLYDLTTSELASAKVALESWLAGANATNMTYMLSAQLAATWLNVNVLGVSGGTMIHVGTLSMWSGNGQGAALATNLGSLVSSTGFVKLSDIINSANALLGTNGSILSGNALRAYAEALKDVCDGFNNNLSIAVIGLVIGWTDTNFNGVLDPGEGLLGSWLWV